MANDFRLPASHSRLTAVLLREWTRMTSRRLYFGTCIVLPLFTLFFMATIFGNGQMENIPIGIVDQDNTATSRTIVRNLSAVPTFKVTRHFVNEAAAREAVQRKEIYGYLSIPPRFEQDAITGKDATLSYYYHYALLSVGGELMAAFETSLAPVALSPIAMQAVALGVSEQQIETFLLPVQASDHPIYNPSLDYSVYLSQPFFFVLFQVLILLVTVYSVGSEIKFRTGDNWLETAGGNMVTAIYCYFQPYCPARQLRHVRHAAYPFSWQLAVDECNDRSLCHRHTGIGTFHLFPFPGRSTHYQHCVYGRFIRGNPVRCHLPCAQYVSVGTRRVISLSGTTLHRDHTNHALFRRRFCLSMAFGSDPLRLPPVGIGNDSPFETSYNQS